MLVLCGFVGLLSGAYGVGYLRRNEARNLVTPRMRREFYGLIPAYVFAMLLVSVSNNLGILWIAVELTTLASVFLITFHDRDTSLEAGWKFLMLGSLGLGVRAARNRAAVRRRARDISERAWPRSTGRASCEAAPSLHPFTLRLGVVFALIGYGTKAGLAPDAHVEAGRVSRSAVAGGRADGGRHAERRALLRPAHPPDFEGGARARRSPEACC